VAGPCDIGWEKVHITKLKMPDDDERLPTYEEATGLQKILPHNISREAARRLTQNQSREQESILCPSLQWIVPILYNFPQIILGVVMIVIGDANKTVCPKSWLPGWLVGCGCSIIIFYILLMIYSVKYFWKDDTESEPIYQSWTAWLMFIDIIFGLIWYGHGAYRTWSSVSDILWARRERILGDIDELWYQESQERACDGYVLWFSLFVTILPFFYIVLTVCLMCVFAMVNKKELIEKTLEDEAVLEESHMVTPAAPTN